MWWGVVLAGVWACSGDAGSLEALRVQGAVYGVPNLDDDDEDGRRDFRDESVSGEDDLAVVDLSELQAAVGNRESVEFVLSGDDIESIRVWDADELLVSGDFPSLVVEGPDVPTELQVEFGGFLDRGALRITYLRSERTWLGATRSEDKRVVDAVTIDLMAAPLVLSHHLQPAESSYVLEGIDGSFQGFSTDNLAMVNTMDEVLGERLVLDDLFAYGFDVWVQDEFETATLTSPTSRIDVVIDSIRDRGLDDFPESVVADGPDTMVRTWGEGRYPTSQDSFGNLEISPPVTVDGVKYPFGRIYWGEWLNGGVVPELADFLGSQRVQAPFTVDVSFLIVGHIDEFTTFVPDSTSPKGFRFLVTDTDVGFAFLDGLPEDAPLHPRYRRQHGYRSVAELRSDPALRALNEDIQRDYIEPAIEVFRRELGLVDDDIVRVPGIFEEIEGPFSAALIPGTVNMLVTTNPDGRVVAFLPDPFLRSSEQTQADDPFIAEFERYLPADLEPVWVDNWDVYHAALGEVHCGTNASRTPTANWWEVALHLIDGEAP